MREILTQALAPSLLEIEDESHSHAGPRIESHFKILIVSDHFQGLSRIDRQRKINELLKDEFTEGLHALTQKTLTPQELRNNPNAREFISPQCRSREKS